MGAPRPKSENPDEYWCAAGRHFAPIAAFNKNATRPDGLDYSCRRHKALAAVSCAAARKARHAEQRPATPRETQRDPRAFMLNADGVNWRRLPHGIHELFN